MLQGPFGAPVALPPCIPHLPFFIAPLRHGFPLRLECAPHRLLWCMANGLFMDLILAFWCTTPGLDVADNGLAAFVHVHMLDALTPAISAGKLWQFLFTALVGPKPLGPRTPHGMRSSMVVTSVCLS